MKDHPLYPLAIKLRPVLMTLDGPAGLQAFSEVLTVLYLIPFSVAGVVWLALIEMNIPSAHDIFLLALIAVGILITNIQTAMIYVRVGSREKLAISSSLGSLLYWAGLLLWGPVTIWASLLADVLTASSNLPVGTLQSFLDTFLKAGSAEKIDYVHGEDVTVKLGSQPGNAGFYLPGMSKSDLFKTVILDGALPRKTFSMGEAREKRFYMEVRKIA